MKLNNNFLIAIALILGVASSSFATTNTVKLHNLVRSIKSLQGNIQRTHNKRQTLQQRLRKNEIAAGNIAIVLRQTKRRLQYEQKLLLRLYKEQRQYRRSLQAQQSNLSEQMRAIYVLGREPTIKLLLNQKDPARISRIFIYYNYLQQYRVILIVRINKLLRHLHANRIEIEKQKRRLQPTKQKLQREYVELLLVKRGRLQLLHKITKKLRTQKARLAKLVSDKKALGRIIARLEAETTSTIFATPLSKLRRKLHWPTKGRVEHLYGKRIANSQLHWNGIIIRAPQGQSVRAIATGKVVFSQWLRGYGLLIIINHGHGYMSLYGRNSSLYKKTGNIVHTGDLIATVGDSGGYTFPGVYFAIRRNGIPVNPSKWCK